MKLEIGEFPVKQIRLGRRFSYEHQALEVDEQALIDLVLEDSRISDASIAVAMPEGTSPIDRLKEEPLPGSRVTRGSTPLARSARASDVATTRNAVRPTTTNTTRSRFRRC